VFTNPIPPIERLGLYYETPDYLSHSVNTLSIKGMIYKLMRNMNIGNKYRLVKKYKETGRIMDIGQGTGEFLHFFSKKGWETIGIEPNAAAREFAEKNYQLQVFDEQKINQLEADQFDIITLWHVLEHVPDLSNRMAQIRRLLNSTGYLIAAVPNLDSHDAKKYGAYWAGLDVPRHLYHFTPTTFNSLLEFHGFEKVKQYPMKLDAYYVSLLSEQYQKSRFGYLRATVNGYLSNHNARRTGNYSSMIFVAKLK
jgi:SAM-dependent methyltransferase